MKLGKKFHRGSLLLMRLVLPLLGALDFFADLFSKLLQCELMSIEQSDWNEILSAFDLNKTSDTNSLCMLEEAPLDSTNVTSHFPSAMSKCMAKHMRQRVVDLRLVFVELLDEGLRFGHVQVA